MMTRRDMRRARGLSLIQVAVAAHVSETTARVYEADPAAVSLPKREALNRVYSALHGEGAQGEGDAHR